MMLYEFKAEWFPSFFSFETISKIIKFTDLLMFKIDTN